MECGVDVRVRALQVGERELTITAVPEVRGRIVTTPNGRLLRRVGGDSQPLRGDALARLSAHISKVPGKRSRRLVSVRRP